MTEDKIKELILRGIRDPGGRRIGPDALTQLLADGVNYLGLLLLRSTPEYWTKRVSVQSVKNNVFAMPADLHKLTAIWDMGTNAKSVSATADNGSGLIKITTSAVHGFSTDDIVTIHGVTGTTEANEQWKITVVDTTSFTLNSSTFTNAWVSGGKVFKEDGDFTLITRKPSNEALLSDNERWFMRGSNIHVDDVGFENDIIIDYTYLPSAVSDFATKLHFGFVAWGVLELIEIPPIEDSNYVSYKASRNHYWAMWKQAEYEIDNFVPSSETRNYGDIERKEHWI